MEKNVMAILGDEFKEESSACIRKWRMRRKRFMKRKDLESGSLPRLAPRDEACKKETKTKPHFRIVFKCVNTSLLAIVGVKYQAISQDPFNNTLALNTWSFLIAILIYSLILFALKQPQNHSNMNLQIILGRVLLASGVVSSLSRISLLLPRFCGLMVLYISWALFVVISALPKLQRAYNGLHTRITTLIDILICFANNLNIGSKFSQQQQPPRETIPPVMLLAVSTADLTIHKKSIHLDNCNDDACRDCCQKACAFLRRL